MVWPIKPDGVAIGENVRSEAHEGQSQRYRFMNGLLQSRVLRSEMDMRERARVATAEAQHPGSRVSGIGVNGNDSSTVRGGRGGFRQRSAP